MPNTSNTSNPSNKLNPSTGIGKTHWLPSSSSSSSSSLSPKLTEQFAIELNNQPTPSGLAYYVDDNLVSYEVSSATHFNSLTTALQFNRIMNGRIVSVFN